MGEIINFPESYYFGDCPECGRNDGYLNVGQAHWFLCDEHKTKWCIGSNLFSTWQGETEETWLRNADKLAGYQEVEPSGKIFFRIKRRS